MKTKITKEGWHVIEGDLISGWVESEKTLQHDKFLPEIAVANMPESGTVLDVGANIGTHTIAYARKVGTHGTVIAIEAGKIAFECLTENAKKFEGKTLLIHAAVCDVHGGSCEHTCNPVNVGASGVHGMPDEKTTCDIYIPHTTEVRTITIDGLIDDADIKRVDFIKIDCEGCEYQILKGAKETLRRFKPKLLIEMNHFRLLEHNASYSMIYDWLLDQGYAWRIVQPESKGGDAQYDILCWPNLVELAKTLPAG